MVARNLIKEQKYYTKEQLLNDTPSRRDGIDASTEAKVRKTYCKLIDAAGQKLKMPQWAIATATVFCHRFYAVKSLRTNDRFLIPTACLFLAGKIDDSPRALNDVIVVCWELRNKHKPQELEKLRNQAFLYELRELVLTAERGILYTRGFDLYVEHPYSPLTNILKEHRLLPSNFPPENAGKNLLQACWNFINDSLKTTVSLQYSPSLIAKAVIYLSARLLKIKLPFLNEKSFAEFFEVDQAVMDDICNQIMDLYTFTDGKKTTGAVKAANYDGVSPAAAESLSPLLASPLDNSVQAAAAKADTATVVVKTEEACLEMGVQKGAAGNPVASVKKEPLIAEGEGAVRSLKQVEGCKKRKAPADVSEMPELKAAKMEGLAC